MHIAVLDKAVVLIVPTPKQEAKILYNLFPGIPSIVCTGHELPTPTREHSKKTPQDTAYVLM